MIALVFCGDLKYCPYIKRYLERLEKENVDYRVYFWNRGGFSLHLDEHYVYYDKSSKLTSGKVKKLLDFLLFRSWLIKKLEDNSHEKIIVLSTLTGVILGRFLYKFKNKYIFDIRDYSYEYIPPFYHIEERLIKNSAFTTISSAGFKAFLPEHDYVIAHNFNRKDINNNYCFTKTSGQINFVWHGVVRFFEFQKAYLDSLKNDPRFKIVFHGDGPELAKYEQYCVSEGFENVVFTGSYDNSEKTKLLESADILNNCYGYTVGAGNKLKYAVSNRFYDGMIYHIPQLVEVGGYKPIWAESSGLGKAFPPEKGFADKLYNYYINIDPEKFDSACETELKKVLNEDDLYIQRIDDFII